MKDDEKIKVQNLVSEEAISKIKELAEKENICAFVTRLSQIPLNARPMSTQQVDEEGNIWFFSGKDSEKNLDIQDDPRVQLFYSNRNSSEYLSIYGTAEILTDAQKTDELWNAMVKAWFKEGKDDPELTLIKVKPEDAYYWDTKHNRAIALIKIAASVVSGKTMDDSVEGTLSVSR